MSNKSDANKTSQSVDIDDQDVNELYSRIWSILPSCQTPGCSGQCDICTRSIGAVTALMREAEIEILRRVLNESDRDRRAIEKEIEMLEAMQPKQDNGDTND